MQRLEGYTRLHRNMLAFVSCLPDASGHFSVSHHLVVLITQFYFIIASCLGIVNAWPNDIYKIAYNLMPFIAAVLLTTKFITYIFYKRENYELMKIIQERFWVSNVKNSIEECEIVERYGRYSYLFHVTVIMIMFSAASMWFIMPFLQMFVFQKQNNELFHRALPFDHQLPFGLDSYADPLYEILFILQFIVVLNGVTLLSSLNCLYIHYIMNICAQFKILQRRFKYFDKNENNEQLNLKEQEEKIKLSIQLHQQLYECCDILETSWNITLFVLFFLSSVFLCTTVFIIAVFPSNKFVYLQNIICMCASLSETFLMSYCCNLITTESEEVSFSVYSSNWIDAPTKIKKMILYILMRSQKPVYFTLGGFAPMSLATWETIIKTAASYFTLLTSMQEEK